MSDHFKKEAKELAETWVKDFDPQIRIHGPDAKVVKFEHGGTETTVHIPPEEHEKYNLACYYLDSLRQIELLTQELKSQEPWKDQIATLVLEKKNRELEATA